jgi:GAF domain-containing protein
MPAGLRRLLRALAGEGGAGQRRLLRGGRRLPSRSGGKAREPAGALDIARLEAARQRLKQEIPPPHDEERP